MKKVLAIIDMQNDFLTGALGNAECEATIDEVVKIIQNGDYERVIITYDTHAPEYLTTQEGRKLPVEHCIKGTDGWQINDRVMAAIRAKFEPLKWLIFEKGTFGSKELGSRMEEIYGDGRDLTVDFAGVCTGICVISNATVLKAFCPEAEINILAKGCACVTPNSHEIALEQMKMLHMNIL